MLLELQSLRLSSKPQSQAPVPGTKAPTASYNTLSFNSKQKAAALVKNLPMLQFWSSSSSSRSRVRLGANTSGSSYQRRGPPSKSDLNFLPPVLQNRCSTGHGPDLLSQKWIQPFNSTPDLDQALQRRTCKNSSIVLAYTCTGFLSGKYR